MDASLNNKTKTSQALIIFTKNPELGHCKTRLAKTIGDTSALAIYKYLLNYTVNITEPLQVDKFVFYSNDIIQNDIWDALIYNKALQKGDDLGIKMFNAFSYVFGLGFKDVIIIGSDILDLKTEHIEIAFNTLKNNEYVIGPSKDGGYYLLGMRLINKNLFLNKKWGTSSVLKDTLKTLKNSTFHILEELNDIDTFEDMKHYKELNKFYTNP